MLFGTLIQYLPLTVVTTSVLLLAAYIMFGFRRRSSSATVTLEKHDPNMHLLSVLQGPMDIIRNIRSAGSWLTGSRRNTDLTLEYIKAYDKTTSTTSTPPSGSLSETRALQVLIDIGRTEFQKFWDAGGSYYFLKRPDWKSPDWLRMKPATSTTLSKRSTTGLTTTAPRNAKRSKSKRKPTSKSMKRTRTE